MRQAITGILVQVEVTGYDEGGKVAARTDSSKPIQFVVLEAAIPPAVLEFVTKAIGLKEEGV